jgi:hypothetical protein
MNSLSRTTYLEDVLLDCLLAEPSVQTASSFEDALKATEIMITSWLQFDDLPEKGRLCVRLARKIIVVKKSKVVKPDGKIGKLLRPLKELTVEDNLLVVYSKHENVGYLSVRIPQLDENNETSMKTLSLLLQLACLMHGVSSERLSYVTDDTLDKTPLEMAASHMKLVERLIASAKNPYGHWDGPDVVFNPESEYKCTPPGLLAATRMLSAKDGLIRKLQFTQASKRKAITPFMLLEKFNTIFMLKGPSKSFSIRLFKAVIASATKLSNRGFPGGFIHSNRARNGVKTDLQVLSMLGWTPKIPSHKRLVEVMFNAVDEDHDAENPSKVVSRKIVNLSKAKRNMGLPEFRACVALTLPKLYPSKGAFDAQLEKEPLGFTDPVVMTNFSENRRIVAVNLLQQSYALKVSLAKPKSKTSITHFGNARNHLINQCSTVELVDGEGNKYANFTAIPQPVQDFLRKKYLYPVKDKARPAPENSQAEMEVEAPGDSASQPITKKKRGLKRSGAVRLRQEEAEQRVTRSMAKKA